MDNQPTAAEIAADLKKRADSLAIAAEAWLKEVPAITTDEQAGSLEDFLKQLRDNYKEIDDERKRLKAPHDKAGKDVQELFTPLLTLIENSALAVKPLKAAWLQLVDRRQKEAAAAAAEAARKAQEEADFARAKVEMGIGSPIRNAAAAQAAEEAAVMAQQAAQVAAAAKPQVRGALTGRASGGRTRWFAKITDPVKALTYYSKHAKLLEVLQSLADADVRAMKENCNVPGIEAASEHVV